MAKKEKPQDDDVEVEVSSEGADSTEPQKGFVKKILGSKKLLLIFGGGALVLLLGLGAGAYFLLFSGGKTADQVAEAPPIPLVPPAVAFLDMPDVVVNIQTADGTPAYLKLGVSLELVSAEEKQGLNVLRPRIVDQFQAYLRELRVDDLKGSAGVLRVKEELLRRVNAAAAPYPVKDVLLKEMIVQ